MLQFCARNACVVLAFLLAGCGLTPEAAKRRYYEAGKKDIERERWADASVNLRRAIQKDAKFADAYYQLGIVETRRNRSQDAFRAFFRAVQLNRGNKDAWVRLGDLSIQFYLTDPRRPKFVRDQIESAIATLAKGDPNGFDALRMRGELNRFDGKLKEALEDFRAADRARPGSPALALSIVQTLFAADLTAEGEKLALDVIAANPAFGPMYDVLAVFYEGATRDADLEKLYANKIGKNPAVAEYRLQLASFYSTRRRPEEAEKQVRALLENTKDFPQAKLQVADYYMRTGKADDAVRLYREGAAQDAARREDYQRRLVMALTGQQKFKDALGVVEQMLKDRPGDSESRAMRAYLWMESRDPAKVAQVRDEYAELVKETPQNAVLRANYGRALQAAGDLNGAALQFREALKYDPGNISAKRSLMEFTLLTRRYSETIQLADELAAQGADDSRRRLLRAAALSSIGRTRDARKDLELVLKSNPESRDAQLQLGLIAISERQFGSAQTVFRKLHQPGSGDLRALQGMVAADLYQNQYDNALQTIEDELKRSPNSRQVRFLLADAAMAAGRFNVALEQLQELYKTDAKSPELTYLIGRANEGKGDLNQAVDWYQKARDLQPRNPKYHAMLAQLLERTGRTAESLTGYRKSLETMPDNVAVLNNLAFMIAESGGNLDEALRYVQRALEKSPNEPAFIDTLGYVYLKRKNTDSAIQVFKNLTTKYPLIPAFHMHLGEALLQKGDAAGGKASLNKALSLKPVPDDEKRIRELLK